MRPLLARNLRMTPGPLPDIVYDPERRVSLDAAGRPLLGGDDGAGAWATTTLTEAATDAPRDRLTMTLTHTRSAMPVPADEGDVQSGISSTRELPLIGRSLP